MTDPHHPGSESGAPEHEEILSALFAQMVVQQTNMAMMLLGKVPHPQTGKTLHDMDGARMFIDQLEMLEAKTRGNLNKDEASLLKQSLMSLRLAFVEAVESPPSSKPASAAPPAAQAESAPVRMRQPTRLLQEAGGAFATFQSVRPVISQF